MQILIKKVDIEKKTEWKEMPEYLTKQRLEKLQAIKSAADYNRCVASGYLQYLMCQRLGIQKPEYVYSEKGKPYLRDMETISFNLSHSGEYVVLAYHKKAAPIGVDIQQIRSMREGMARRILHEKEWEVFEQRRLGNRDYEQELVGQELKQRRLYASDDEQGLLQVDEVNSFLNRVWAVKESYVKMTGDGLSLDFRNIWIDFAENRITAQNKESACFCVCDEMPGYMLALSTTMAFEVHMEEVN